MFYIDDINDGLRGLLLQQGFHYQYLKHTKCSFVIFLNKRKAVNMKACRVCFGFLRYLYRFIQRNELRYTF